MPPTLPRLVYRKRKSKRGGTTVIVSTMSNIFISMVDVSSVGGIVTEVTNIGRLFVVQKKLDKIGVLSHYRHEILANFL